MEKLAKTRIEVAQRTSDYKYKHFDDETNVVTMQDNSE